MATGRIETQLTIKAIDQYSGMLKNMRTVTGRFAEGVRTRMGSLQKLRGPLKLIEDFRRQRDVVRKSGDALDAAREKQRRLLADIRATRTPTARMRRAFEQTRQAADRLEQAHTRNRRQLHAMRSDLRQAGVNTADLAGEQRRLTGALNGATTAFGRQMEHLRRLETMQKRIATARERMDRSLATAANLSFVGNASMQTGRRLLTGLSGPVRQAVEFETAMSDVRKVVEFENPEAFGRMSDDILQLSTRIPMAAEGLARIVAAGGQSGLANEELLAFSEMAAKIGVAFDISAERSGDAMANIKTALGLTLDETGALFDAMNHLSNNMASTAPKVLDFTTRVAADGKVKGFNATETLAFGSAMIAAGAQADVAATSFRNMGKALTRGAASTSRQRAAFRSLDLDARDVARRMQEDAVATTLDVMERINRLPGDLRSSTMSQIFGDEARALAPLIGNLDLLRESLGLVANEREYLGSAEAEYAARAETTANNLQLMRNQMARLGVGIGSVVLPPLNDLLEKAQVVIDRFAVWTEQHPRLTKWLIIGGAAIGSMAVAGGVLLTAATGLIGTLAVLRFGLIGLGARAMFAGGGLIRLAGRFGALRRLPRVRLARLVTPLRWAAGLVPSIRWSSLAGRLRWTSLIRPLAWLGRGALRFIPVIGWAALAGELAWRLLIKPLGWDEYLPSIDWARIWGAFSWEGWLPNVDWSEFVSAIDWPQWVSRIDWGDWVGSFSWSDVIDPFGWGHWLTERLDLKTWVSGFSWSDVINPLAWGDWVADKLDLAAWVSGFKWKDLIAPLKWDGYLSPIAWEEWLPEIDWTRWFGFSWSDVLPTWNWDFITEFDLSALIRWPEPPGWLKWLMGREDAPVAAPGDVQARAAGGPFGAGPLLVGERGPELYFPDRSGFIATTRQLQGLHRAAQGVRAAGLAALSTAVLAAPATAGTQAGGGMGSGQPAGINVSVAINGGINIQVPAGITDPEAIADLLADRIGRRVAATVSASFSD